MKGIIFKLFEEYTENALGREVLTEAKRRCGLEKAIFLATSSYPDEQLFSLVKAVAEVAQKSVDEVLYECGKYAIKPLSEIYSPFFRAESAKDFLKKMDRVHVSMTRSLPDARPPRFTYREPSERELVIVYRSPRRLCTFAKGLIAGVAEYFQEQITVEEKHCMKQGHPACELHLTFGET
ncbi:MAG: hypothetical protein DRI61_13995 [Chloroflexi bacterium]|nr:MAG: hypothetical protein DRI61_13995 [Chloroflexota bacterium]HDN80234.1 hypothetical protein [Chloroflexota bacterium]